MQRRCLVAALAAALTCALAPNAVAKQRAADRLDVYTVVTTADKLADFEAKGLDVAESEASGSGVTAQMIMTKDQVAHGPRRRRDGEAHARQGRQDGQAVRGGAGRQRLQRLALVRRAGRVPGSDVRDRAQQPRGHQAREARHDAQRPRDPCAQGDPGRPRTSRRQPSRGALQRDAARPRVDRGRDGSPPDVPLRQRLAQRQADQGAAQVDRGVVRPGHEPGRLPVLVRRRAAVAQEPARQRRRQPDDDLRRRRPEPQLPRALQLRQRGLVLDPLEPDLPRSRPAARRRRRRRCRACSRGSPFSFQVNYHSAGEWLLYPEGWQVGSPTADDPIYFALSGNLDRPAIEGYHPGLSSDVLYVTNGEANDYSHNVGKTLAWTPELAEGCDGCGFVFPDDEALVQAEFERNLPFAESVANSAKDPDDPKSSLGHRDQAVLHPQRRPVQGGRPGRELRVPVLLRRSAAGAGAGQARARPR